MGVGVGGLGEYLHILPPGEVIRNAGSQRNCGFQNESVVCKSTNYIMNEGVVILGRGG